MDVDLRAIDGQDAALLLNLRQLQQLFAQQAFDLAQGGDAPFFIRVLAQITADGRRRRQRLGEAKQPAPEVIAEEIVESLTAALEQFSAVAAELSGNGNDAEPADEGDAVAELLPDEENRI